MNIFFKKYNKTWKIMKIHKNIVWVFEQKKIMNIYFLILQNLYIHMQAVM